MSLSESELQGPAETGIIMVPVFVVGELIKNQTWKPIDGVRGVLLNVKSSAVLEKST